MQAIGMRRSGKAQNQTINVGAVTFNADGTTNISGAGATISPANWHNVPTGGVGGEYWINITRTGGTGGVNFSNAQGAWTRISTSGLNVAAGGAAGSCTGTYQIARDSAGSFVEASGTITCNNTI